MLKQKTKMGENQKTVNDKTNWEEDSVKGKDVRIIIPARYGSSRFPGKPLAILGDKPVIIHVCEAAGAVTSQVAVATDDERIAEAVESYGYRAVLVKENCSSGTERVAIANRMLGGSPKLIMNLQGDEPLISAEQLELLVENFDISSDISISTLGLAGDVTPEDMKDENVVKVKVCEDGLARDFFRSCGRGTDGICGCERDVNDEVMIHIGVYCFKPDALNATVALSPTGRENSERLEQLRWLENGYKIGVRRTDKRTIGIDTPEDLAKAKKIIESKL